MSDAKEPSDQPSDVSTVEDAPTKIWGIIRRLGPGLIVAGSIVGSGELIATTATGAQAGFSLLWLILIGCVIKVFVQIELGRYAITHGETTLAGMNRIPGPTLAVSKSGSANAKPFLGNWLLWYWVLMFLASLGQLGGIVGGVGQALAISFPLTSDGRAFNEQVDQETRYQIAVKELPVLQKRASAGEEVDQERIAELKEDLKLGPKVVEARQEFVKQQLAAAQAAADDAQVKRLTKLQAIVTARIDEHGQRPEKVFDKKAPQLEDMSGEFVDAFMNFGKRSGYDDKLWAAMITVLTAVVLVMGRYRFIQSFSTFMVASFTLITIVNLVMLQTTAYSVTGEDIVYGMSFRLPVMNPETNLFPLATALATFGIIGVGASELITYPYWCLEKGYARFTGERDNSDAWAHRARGWMRVMRWDAWCSMIIYTFATVAFYLLGAAVLGRIGLNPEGTEMIRTLSVMYEPVFGQATQMLFLFGAFAVLYSTFFVANASHARVFPDAMRVCGIGSNDERSYRRLIRIFSAIFPFLCLTVYIFFPKPTMLVLLGATMQAIMLPMVSFAAIYFRYKQSDSRITPGKLWDAFLWVSAIGMLIAGGWLARTKVFPALKELA